MPLEVIEPTEPRAALYPFLGTLLRQAPVVRHDAARLLQRHLPLPRLQPVNENGLFARVKACDQLIAQLAVFIADAVPTPFARRKLTKEIRDLPTVSRGKFAELTVDRR